MFFFKLSIYTQIKLNFSYYSKRKFFILLKNEKNIKLNLHYKLKYKSNSVELIKVCFNSLSDKKKKTFEEKSKNIIIKDDAYENNECIYIKNEKKLVVIKKNKSIANENNIKDYHLNDKIKFKGEGQINKCDDIEEDILYNKLGDDIEHSYYDNSNDNIEKKNNSSTNISDVIEKNNNFIYTNYDIQENNKLIILNEIEKYKDYMNNVNDDTKKRGNNFNNVTKCDRGKESYFSNNINDDVEKKKNEALMKILTEENDNIMLRKEKRFCDFLWITAKSGKGGSPNYKKQRSRKLKGEGYGGHGGNIILKSKKSIYDLIKIEQKIKAHDGEDFKENSRGKDGKDKIVYVPVGTIVRKRISCMKKNENNRKIYKSVFWYQFLNENEELLVARGGKGGISYSYFKKHDFRLPEKSEKVLLELELRLLNDVAFIGIENSGKTSLCSSLSKYYGNINSDIFTTTIPHVSNINYIDGVQITLLDTPFLFYNAHKDKNKGKRILRHLYRSKLIVYVIDVSNDKLKNVDDLQIKDYYSESLRKENYANNKEINYENNKDIKNQLDNKIKSQIIYREEKDDNNLKDYYNDTIKQIKMLRNELFLFNPEYLKKKELVVATKCDMLHKNSLFNLDSLYYRLKNIFPEIEVVGTSAKFGLGIKSLSKKIRELIYPQYVLQNNKLYSKNIEDYIIPTYQDFKEGKIKLKSYELPENIKHIYDHNYMENFEYFLKKKKKNVDIHENEIKSTESSIKFLIDDKT
ncbi:GTP-binding protein, putative [Plasmodium relictum]|uniref:GTP-binding protein, putative n=1 Tax=Plasmodium relictum TaxID=85471 RepID=A0A1J1HHE9_PLARL|nr:GTP-binding protein, putative [Plasmodium relictum]CRH03708.1 GTP-binding protein, putative [Plasmodium relictum]